MPKSLKRGKKLFIIFAITGLIVFAFFVALVLNGYGFDFYLNGARNFSVYALCKTENTLLSAQSEANAIKTKGGAGYIIKEDKYLVVLNIYLTKTDAEKVLKNQTITDLVIKEFSIKKMQSINNTQMSKEVLQTAKTLVSNIYSLSNQYDKGSITFGTLSQKIAEQAFFVKSQKSKLDEIKLQFSEDNYNRLSLELFKAETYLTNFVFNGEQNAGSEIKYLNCYIFEIFR